MVNESWLEIEVNGVRSRADLRSGLTRLGGAGCDVFIPGGPSGELHVWSDPPKVIHISGEAPLEVSGSEVLEAELSDGDSFRWGGVSVLYRFARPVLEELEVPPPPLAPPPRVPPAVPSSPPATVGRPLDLTERAWGRVRAGLIIDLGGAERQVVSRWQEAVLGNRFDPDACAREVLACGEMGTDDPRLVERSGRLLRDFLMASLQRGVQGASRQIRAQARTGTAVLLANVVAITVYTLILLVSMTLVRLKWGTSFDGFFDFLLGRGQG